jgi:hypothetical protein
MRAPNCVFPSLVDNIHIMGPMNEISHAFDHLLTQLAQVGLKVKVQVLESIRDLFRNKNSSRLHFGHRWLTHFECASGILGLCHAFFK